MKRDRLFKPIKSFVLRAGLPAALGALSASSALADFSVVRGPYWPGETDYYYGNTRISDSATINNSGSMTYSSSSLPGNTGTIEQGIYRSGDFYWGVGLLDWGADGATINNNGTIQGIVSGTGEAQGEGILSLQYLTVNNWGLIDGQVRNHDGAAAGIRGSGGITLYNHAGATISASAPFWADAVNVPNNVHIVNDGTITATAYAGTENANGYNSTGQAVVAGISTGGGSPGDTAYFENNGTISVYIPDTKATNWARAQAFTSWFGIPVVWKNTGTISAQSDSPLGGAETFYFGAQDQPMTITNSGTISASGVSSTALWMENDGRTGDMTITNTGTISVNGPDPGFAILTAAWGPPNNIHVHYKNSGTISGGMLVLGFPSTVYESGQIHTTNYAVGDGSDVHITGLPTIDPVMDGGGSHTSTLDFNLTGTLEQINGQPANGATSFSGLAGEGSIVVSGKTYRWNNFANGVHGTCNSGGNSDGNSCTQTTITPYVQVNDGSWQQTASVTVTSGDQITFGPQSVNNGTWSWNGCGTSGNSREQTISPTGSCTATATYTTSCGTQIEKQFTVNVNQDSTPDSTPTAGAIQNGRYNIVSSLSGLYLDVYGARNDDGTDVIQYPNNGGANQQFDVEALGDGTYSIRAAHSGKALDVFQWNGDDGADLCQWSYTGGTNQRWRIDDTGGGLYSITSAFSNKVLDVWQMSKSSGAEVKLFQWWGGANQRWEFVRVGSSPN